jgi:hypothetical protein
MSKIDRLQRFKAWVAELLEKQYGEWVGRPYGRYGHCEATAKTTDERCRQPATGDHGTYYYRGEAPDSGAPESNQNAASTDAD